MGHPDQRLSLVVLCTVVLLLTGIFSTAEAGREVISLDLDWRFSHVNPGESEGALLGELVRKQICHQGLFEPLESDTGCRGLVRVYPGGSALGQGWYNTGPGSIDQETCRSICCANNEECSVWNWCPKETKGGCYVGGGVLAENGTCWIGWGNDWNSSTACKQTNGWVGGSRRVPQHVFAPGPTERATGAAGRDFDDSSWAVKSLPHDFVVEGTPDMVNGDKSHGYLPKGIGWYRRKFSLSAADKDRDLSLEFAGAYRDALVYVNGRFVGRHKSGYTSFSFKLPSDFVYIGEGETNTLAVRVDANLNEGWFYEGGGLYRGVQLVKTEHVHIAQWGVFAPATVQKPFTYTAAAHATVTPSTELLNSGASTVSYTLVSQVEDQLGQVVAEGSVKGTLAPTGQSSQIVQQVLPMTDINLWSPDQPYLYTLVTKVEQPGSSDSSRVVDEVRTPFGIRDIVHNVTSGLYINGRRTKVQGFCNHQDFGGVGTAVPPRLQTFRVHMLREAGTNGWRMAHGPSNPDLLDACDAGGMMVWAENRNFGVEPDGILAADELITNVESLVKRDRNHPSIIWWSLCNEIGCVARTEQEELTRGKDAILAIKALDPTRPVTGAINFGAKDYCTEDCLSSELDIEGFNYNFQDWLGYHKNHSSQPLISSECSRGESTRGIYETDEGKGYKDVYESAMMSFDGTLSGYPQTWEQISGDDYVSGGFYWTGYDYKGEPAFPQNINSQFGILDIAGFKKDSYYWFQSQWTNKPVLHLLPHWSFPSTDRGKRKLVRAYTNAHSVLLELDGQVVGNQTVRKLGWAEWNVTFKEGVLGAKGYDDAGRVIATDVVKTAGPAAKLRLSVEEVGSGSAPSTLLADGMDVGILRVEVQDKEGYIVPTADSLISYSVAGAGRLLGVANGNPSDLTPDKSHSRNAFNGLGRVLIQTKAGVAGKLEVHVRSSGLMGDMVTLNAELPVR